MNPFGREKEKEEDQRKIIVICNELAHADLIQNFLQEELDNVVSRRLNKMGNYLIEVT